jgi:hypothetical protein
LDNHLHIISFDVPFPANYGGVIDVFYKLQALKKQGVKIYLHCFIYGRQETIALEELCEKVFYYPRKTGFLSHLSLLPYTVKSRQSKELEKNLLENDFPILCEVLHTCYLLNDIRFKHRKKIYRHSNIEHEYYRELFKSERNLLKKGYLKLEAWKLKRFEKILIFADLVLCVNQKDTDYFKRKYPTVTSLYIPSFHPNTELRLKFGKGNFILFHGNLSVSENYNAAVWLIEHVFSKISYTCIISGLNPPNFLKKLIESYAHITLVSNPSEQEMMELISDAHIHALYTSQPTGLKLKLLNVLFNGRFIICNPYLISGTDLVENDSLFVCNQANQFIERMSECMNKDFSNDFMMARKKVIASFDNKSNAHKLIDAVF